MESHHLCKKPGKRCSVFNGRSGGSVQVDDLIAAAMGGVWCTANDALIWLLKNGRCSGVMVPVPGVICSWVDNTYLLFTSLVIKLVVGPISCV